MKLVAPHNRAMRTPCKYVENAETQVRPYIPLLIRTMRINDGIGITANQVGHNDAVFITNVEGDHIRIYVNPEIVAESEQEMAGMEGCLSFPGKHLSTKRKRHVVIRAFNLKGYEFIVDTSASIYRPKVSAILSMCLQHEMDHIDGVDMRKYLVSD